VMSGKGGKIGKRHKKSKGLPLNKEGVLDKTPSRTTSALKRKRSGLQREEKKVEKTCT